MIQAPMGNMPAPMMDPALMWRIVRMSGNATFQVLNPFNWRQDIARVDYRPADSNSIYFRWLHDHYDLVDPFGTFTSSQLPTTPTARNRPVNGTANHAPQGC